MIAACGCWMETSSHAQMSDILSCVDAAPMCVFRVKCAAGLEVWLFLCLCAPVSVVDMQ